MREHAVRLGLAALLSACARHESPTPLPTASAQPRGSQVGAATAPATSADAAATRQWAELIRDERWDDAWLALEALPAADKDAPEQRYARARVALHRGDKVKSLSLFEGLEAVLPLLTEDIARRKAEARLETGPFDAAGEYFAARPGAGAQLKAAQAFAKAGDARARTAADRVILADKRTPGQEAEARAIRMKLGGPPSAVAADARWIRVHAPDSTFEKDAESTLARTDPSHPLTPEEWMTRARALGDAGKTADAIAAVDHAVAAPGTPPTLAERARVKGNALLRSKARVGEAWSMFTQAARAGGPRAAEDALFAARALARADRDDEAIREYLALEKRFPKTTWADQAAYQAARLHFVHTRWYEARALFDAYLKHYPNGAERKDASRNLALSRLLSGEAKGARRLFGQIADDEATNLEGARAATMEALAALKEGDRTHAVARWSEVIRSRPLSWPSLVARARLAEVGAQIPPSFEPATEAAAPPPLNVTLPPPVDMLHRLGFDGDAEEALASREAVVSRAAADRGLEALCTAYGMLGRARRRYEIALQIPAAILARPPGPATRWAWECTYPSPHAELVRAMEESAHVPEGLVYSVMRQESNFNPDAVSSARAVGLLQLLPETARDVAEARKSAYDDGWLTSPAHNVELGTAHLGDLLSRFDGAVALAVGAYNAGAEAILRWLRRSPFDLDVFVEFIPFGETRTYVARVLGNLARYGYMKRGDEGIPAFRMSPPQIHH